MKIQFIKAIGLLTGLIVSFFQGPALADVEVQQSGSSVTVVSEYYSLDFDLRKGVWNAEWADGRPLLRNVYGLWKLRGEGGEVKVVATAGSAQREFRVYETDAPLGHVKRLEISAKHPSLPITAVTRFSFHADEPFFVVDQSLIKSGGKSGNAKYRVVKTVPLEATARRGGGFFPGPAPDMVRVLENGYNLFFDFFLRVVNANESVNANWNAAYYDRETGRTCVLGFISTDRAFVSVRTHFNPDKKHLSHDGWSALSSISAEAAYDPAPPLAPGEPFKTERLYVGLKNPDTQDGQTGAKNGRLPHPALELFAEVIARNYDIDIFEENIPTGWNVWATRYHHGITHDNILENARRARDLFFPFGMKTFQVDDGWQLAHGDWFANKKFPGGMGKIASEIEKLGFTPGIWTQPFCISTDSTLAAEHPDWIAPKNKKGEMMIPDDWLVLDPSHPEVLDWLDETYRRISREWGFKVLKIDFIYFALLAERYHDPDVTAVEAFRRGVRAIREAMAPDGFLIMVGVPVGNSVGLADGMRLGLDVTPEWQDDEGYAAQGVKPMVRNVARRYYLNHRVWINHPDMFYLGAPEETQRWDGNRLTIEEARTYATLSCIQGGIVKIGDSFVGLEKEHIDLLRPLLPVYPAAARPIDLFERLYPEIWHLPISTPALDYELVTLFNWGRNRRWGDPVEEAAKELSVDLSLLGLEPGREYHVTESWSGEYLGAVRGHAQTVEIPPRRVRVFALRPALPRPQFIYTNRHITQGAVDIESIAWNEEKSTLTGKQRAVAGFEYTLKFHVPQEYEPVSATVDGSAADFSMDNKVLEISFVPSAGSEKAEWVLVFRKR